MSMYQAINKIKSLRLIKWKVKNLITKSGRAKSWKKK